VALPYLYPLLFAVSVVSVLPSLWYEQRAESYHSPDSEISADDVIAPYNGGESIKDRVLALRDILPPSTRRRIVSSYETVKGYAWYGLSLSGKTAWVVSTSALLLGVPFILAVVEEQQVVEAEKEQRMRDMGNEVSSQVKHHTSGG